VVNRTLQTFKKAVAGAFAISLLAGQVQAESHATVVGEEYTPTIWIDPDGCQHWVMDDGFEGFLIYGHTDARASDEYNIDLSNRRAAMVASIARDAGVRVVDVKGFGERQPRATGNSAAAYQQNRRVEIYCVK